MLIKRSFTVLDVILWDVLEAVILFGPVARHETERWESHECKPQNVDKETSLLLQDMLKTDECGLEKFLVVCVDRVFIQMLPGRVLRISTLRRRIELEAKARGESFRIELLYDSKFTKSHIVDHCLSRFIE